MSIRSVVVAEPDKYSHIDFKPSDAIAKAAQSGLDMRERATSKGGTSIGIARARDLSNRKNLSPSTVKRMKSYFERHEVDKKGEGWGKESRGQQAWLLWGGEPGYSWARKVCKQIDAADGKTEAADANSITPHTVVETYTDETLYSGTLEHCIVFIEGFDAGSDTYRDLRVHDENGDIVDDEQAAQLDDAETATDDLKDTCWDGYEAIGLKKKNGRMVPNCVPKDKSKSQKFSPKETQK